MIIKGLKVYFQRKCGYQRLGNLGVFDMVIVLSVEMRASGADNLFGDFINGAGVVVIDYYFPIGDFGVHESFRVDF